MLFKHGKVPVGLVTLTHPAHILVLKDTKRNVPGINRKVLKRHYTDHCDRYHKGAECGEAKLVLFNLGLAHKATSDAWINPIRRRKWFV